MEVTVDFIDYKCYISSEMVKHSTLTKSKVHVEMRVGDANRIHVSETFRYQMFCFLSFSWEMESVTISAHLMTPQKGPGKTANGNCAGTLVWDNLFNRQCLLWTKHCGYRDDSSMIFLWFIMTISDCNKRRELLSSFRANPGITSLLDIIDKGHVTRTLFRTLC